MPSTTSLMCPLPVEWDHCYKLKGHKGTCNERPTWWTQGKADALRRLAWFEQGYNPLVRETA